MHAQIILYIIFLTKDCLNYKKQIWRFFPFHARKQVKVKFVNLLRLGFLRVVFSGEINLDPLPILLHS